MTQPKAITDGDSIVHFRRADVIVTGDIFTTTQYPFIDVASGGTVRWRDQGAQRSILERTVFEHQGEGGTLRRARATGTCRDEHEVVEYRDMVVDRPRSHSGAGSSPGRRSSR